MKIAVLTASMSRRAGGLFQSVRYLHQELADDLLTRVLTLRDDFSSEDELAWQPLAVETFASVGPKAIGFSPAMLRSVSKFAPDIIHVHGLWQGPSIASLQYRSRAKCPSMISPRGMLDPWALANSGWRKRLAATLYERKHLSGATVIHALCDSERHSIRAAGFDRPVAVIPNGVHLPECVVRGNLNREGKALLFLGRLHPKKGLSNFIDSWQRLRHRKSMEEMQGWHAVIAGWDQGQHRASMIEQCRDRGVPVQETDCTTYLQLRSQQAMTIAPGTIFWVGPAFGEQKDRLLRAVDGFVLPSHSEGLPISVLEAWAYELPVAMTRACNLPEGFSSGAATELSLNEDGELFVDSLGQFLSQSDCELSNMGNRGRQLVEQRFTWSSVATQMKTVYQWMLAGGAVPETLEILDSPSRGATIPQIAG